MPKEIIISTMTRIYQNPRTNLPQLSMAEITGYEVFKSFSDLRDHVIGTLRYPKPQQDKLESFGWVPTLFDLTDRTFRSRKHSGTTFTRNGSWRIEHAEASHLTVFYADVDNAAADQPIITPEGVVANMQAKGLGDINLFTYTSYSHSPARPKFRVVIDIDRPITRTEAAKLFMWLDWAVLGHQGDASIYDPADFIFAPPYHTITMEAMAGAELNVDAILAKTDALLASEPTVAAGFLRRNEPKAIKIPRVPSEEERAVMVARQGNLSVRPLISLTNPEVFNPLWLDLYRQADSHWECMRSLLAMVWLKNGGDLTWGEMLHLFDQIDATADGYFAAVHGEAKKLDLIGFIMDQPVEEDEADFVSVLEREDVDLEISYIEGECGAGKTFATFGVMAAEKGRYVYVVDKIENIEKRKREFQKQAGKWTAMRFRYFEAHSKSDENLRVGAQLNFIRKEINALPAGQPVVVFLTQAAMLLMNFDRWRDFDLIIDEVPEVFQVYSLRVANHFDLLRQYVQPIRPDGNCWLLGLTDAGREAARAAVLDDYDMVHYGLLMLLDKPNTLVWVKAAGWDGTDAGRTLEFFAIASPHHLSPFRSVTMLGDELTKSVTARVWSQKWDVKFTPLPFTPTRTRTMALKDRATIYYFSDSRDSSLTRFGEADGPLEAVSGWIAKHAGSDVLWTANGRTRERITLPENHFENPKSHGRNDLQHYRAVAFLAAMKGSKFEIGQLKSICGMTAQQLADWREYNVLYQFVLRSNLRDFASADPVTVYVFSRRQAEYLRDRLGGAPIRKIDGVVEDGDTSKALVDGLAMSNTERSKAKYWRDKMITAGVHDVRQMPKSGKLSSREVAIINASYQNVVACLRQAGSGS